MILSDTLAVNGLYNNAARLALWEADTVVHLEKFSLVSQVLKHVCMYHVIIIAVCIRGKYDLDGHYSRFADSRFAMLELHNAVVLYANI